MKSGQHGPPPARPATGVHNGGDARSPDSRPGRPVRPADRRRRARRQCDAGADTRSDADAAGEPLPLPGFLTPADAAGAHRAPARQGRLPLWARLLGRPLHPWLKLDIETDPQVGADAAPDLLRAGRLRPVQRADPGRAPAARPACRSPLQPLRRRPAGAQARLRGAVAAQCQRAGPLAAGRRRTRPIPARWRGCWHAHRADPALDVQLVPVSIFVGRAPGQRSSGWFSVLFSENWTLVGRFRRLLAILLNGRDTLVQFAAADRPCATSSPRA